jgi:hypothetical protein
MSALVGLLAAVLAGAPTATPSSTTTGAAGWPPYLAQADDPAVTTLAADLGISNREAQRRIGWQGPAVELARDLERELGDRYGDLWFDAAGGGRVKVGIVGGDTALAAHLIAERELTAVTDLVRVRRSYADLKRAETWLTAEMARVSPPSGDGAVKGLMAWRLPDRNMIELSLPHGRRLSPAQQVLITEARRHLGDMLTLGAWSGQTQDLSCSWLPNPSTFDCDPPLRGGVMLYIRSGASYIPQCTAGFNARSNTDGKWYVLTAGHCGPEGRNFYVYQHRTGQYHLLGHMHNRVYGTGDDDFGIITIDNVTGWNPQPWVYVHSSADTVYNPTYSITGTEGSWQGLRVCVSGAVSGSDCGNVEALGGGSYARVDLCAGPGDSGAPIFSLGKARGLLKGANAPDPGQDPPGPCDDRLYQGLPEAEHALRVSAAHT